MHGDPITSHLDQQMDWSEIIRKMVIVAEETGQITFAQINELIPPVVAVEDFERLIDALNAQGIWIVDEDPG